MQWTTARRRAAAAMAMLLGTLAGGLAPTAAAAQDGGDTRDGSDAFVDGADASSDGRSATGTAATTIPGSSGGGAGRSGGGSGGPNCTRSDGERDYLRYEGLQVTTMEQQRTEIRPEEQRPGVYLHVYCGNDWLEFRFFPEAPAAPQVDPVALAESVTITPSEPALATSPGSGDHLVEVESWFWVENWAPVTAPPAVAGLVEVNVSAEPSALVIDPGDGSPAFTCTGRPPAYDTSRPSSAQSSTCTHTYTRAGTFTATATLVYDVGFTSNVGVGGPLDDIEATTTVEMAVREGQAIVVD